MLHVSGNTNISDSLYVNTTTGISGNTYVGSVLGVSGLTYLGNDLHIKDDQFIYFGAETDTETRIRRTSNNLKIEAADDILLLPDDDLKIGVGATQYAIFDGGTKSLTVGSTSIPTSRLSLKVGTQTTNFNERAISPGCTAHDLYADMVTDQASTMRLVFGETTLVEEGGNHTFVIFPSPSSMPNENYSGDIVLGGYEATTTCASEILRIDGSASRVGIKNAAPDYDLDVTGTFRATTNAVIGGDLVATNITASNNLYISGDTHHEGAFSATGNITTSENLFVSGNTFYEGALSGTGDISTSSDVIVAGNVGIGTETPLIVLDVHHNPTNLADNTGGGEVVTFGTEDGTDTLAAGRLVYLNTSGVWKFLMY